MVRAGPFFGCVFEFLAAGAGVEWGAAVAGGEVVGRQFWVAEALLFVVGRGEAGDELAGAVGCYLIIVVAVERIVSECNLGAGKWGNIRTIQSLPGSKSSCG